MPVIEMRGIPLTRIDHITVQLTARPCQFTANVYNSFTLLGRPVQPWGLRGDLEIQVTRRGVHDRDDGGDRGCAAAATNAMT